jgi:hypothetical protein
MNGLDYKVQIVIQDYLLLMDLVVNLQVRKTKTGERNIHER